MVKFLTRTIVLITAIFCMGSLMSFSQEMTTEDLIKTIKRGSTAEKLEAAIKLKEIGTGAAAAEKELIKILKKNNDAKNGIA